MNIETVFPRNSYGRLILLMVLLFGSGCATTPMTTVRQHPELEQRLTRIRSIAILPVEVAYLHKTVSGDELQPEKERDLQRDFMTTLGRMLESKRYQVVRMEPALADTMNAGTPEIRQLREDANSASNQVSLAVPVTEMTVSMSITGSTVQSLAKIKKADALLLARYNGHDSSGGRTAARVVTAGIIGGLTGYTAVPPNAGGTCDLLLVDGESGDVLWTNHLAGSTDRKRGSLPRPGLYYGPTDMMLKAVSSFPEKPASP